MFVNSKTGKTWAIGQDVDCLSYELKITMGEAKAIMDEGNGMGVASILAILRENWQSKNGKGISTANNKPAYMRTIIRNQTSKGKANQQAEPTSTTPPEQAPAAPKAAAKPDSLTETDKLDAMVLEAFVKLGVAGGNGKYTLVELGETIRPGQSEKGRAAMCCHLDDMRLRNLIALDGAGHYSVISVMVAPVVEPTPEPAAVTYPLPPAETTPEPVTPVVAQKAPVVETKVDIPEPPAIVEEPAAWNEDDYRKRFAMTNFKRPRVVISAPAAPWAPIPVDPNDWVGKPSANDEPHAPTDYVYVYDPDDPFDTKGMVRPDDMPVVLDLQATRDAAHNAAMARINREMAADEAAKAAKAAEIMPDIVPIVEEPVAPPQDAPLTEQIVWQVQHGVHDVLAFMKACGKDYDAVIRAVTILRKKNIIRMVGGRWHMVEPTEQEIAA